MKLSAQLRQALGLADDTPEDVPDETLFPALAGLAAEAAAGRTLLTAAREECLRVATLAEAGADGQLPAAIAGTINDAGADRLGELTNLYAEKAAARFSATCQECGSTNVSGRSSVEAAPDAAVTQQARPAVTADSLH